MQADLGPFTLVAPLARGGMAEVWRARHRELDLDAAVKLVRAEPAHQARYRSALESELTFVAALDHPHVVRLYDAGELQEPLGSLEAGSPYLVMELAMGSMRHHPPTGFSAIRSALQQVLAGLAHCHAAGVLHRDLKPHNVLRFDHGLWKLADFGLARQARDPRAELRESPTGTPRYMAPEQLQGRFRAYGATTDLFSVGCIAWELVAGRAPFARPSRDAEVQAALRTDLPELVPQVAVPEGLGDWLQRLLAPHPEDRFPSAAAASRALGALGGAVVDPAALDPAPAEVAAASTWASLPVAPQEVEPVPRAPAPDVPQPEGAVPEHWPRPPPRGQRPYLATGLGLVALRTPSLVGRNAERERLWALFREAAAGAPRVALLVGRPGTGRSRLAEWLGRTAHALGLAQHTRVEHGEGEAPGAGLRRLTATITRCSGLGGEALETQLREWLAAHRAPEAIVPSVLAAAGVTQGAAVPDAARVQGALAVARLRAAGRPVILVLDDAVEHAGSVALACSALERAGRLLVLITATPEQVEAPTPAVARLLERGAAVVELGPLEPAEHTQLVRSLLGLDPELQRHVVARTREAPGDAVALVSRCVAAGVLVPGERGFRALGPLPAPVVDRPAGLPADAEGSAALEIAACFAGDFAAADWEAAARPSLGLVRLALQQGVLRERQGRWRFASGEVRRWFLQRAEAHGRREAHEQRVADALEGAGASPAVVAVHLGRAGQPEAAWEALFAEGEACLRAQRRNDGLHCADLAVAMLDRAGAPESDRRRVRTWLLRAALARHLDPEVVQRSAEQARAVADAQGWSDLAGRAATALAWCAFGTPQPRAEIAAAFEQASAACRAGGDAAGALEAWVGAAHAWGGAGHPDRADQFLQRVLAEGPDPELGAQVVLARGDLANDRDHQEEAIRWFQQAQQAFEALDRPLQATHALLSRSTTLITLGRLDEARSLLQEGRAACDALGSQRGRMACSVNLLRIALSEDPVEAEALARALIASDFSPEAQYLGTWNLGIALLNQCRLDEARQVLETTCQELERRGMATEQVALAIRVCRAGLGDAQARAEAIAGVREAPASLRESLEALAAGAARAGDETVQELAEALIRAHAEG